MNIRSVEIEQNSQKLYVGAVRAGDVIARSKVDVWKTDNQNGYQREVIASRAKAFGRYLVKTKGLSPNALLLNIRETENIRYKDGVLQIPDNIPLWVVDGQHRMKGIEQMMLEGDTYLGEFELPVVITLIPDTYEEAKQFAIVNKMQKGIRPDLAERFLQKAIEREGVKEIHTQAEQGILRTLLKGYEWRPKALEIADALNTRADSLWHHSIRVPNEPRAGTVTTQKTFVDSLETILKDTFFETKDNDTLTKVLINYWNAIKDVWTEPFDDPMNYVLQKTTGCFVMHRLLCIISSYSIDTEGKRILNRESLATIISKLVEEGVTSDYWASTGEAGRYGTNKKGIKLLYDELSGKLATSLGMKNDDIQL